MPELPEVETVKNALRQTLANCEFRSIETFAPTLRYPLDELHNPALLNSPVQEVRRRARYIIIELANKHGILLHLGMSGNLRSAKNGSPRTKHEHVVFNLNNGESIFFNCPRRFGFVMQFKIEKSGDDPPQLNALGPEPLSRKFNPEYLRNSLRRRKATVKSLIMDNRIVVGVGNIYAAEALFRSRINPHTQGHKISLKKCARLTEHIKAVLQEAIEAGGTTIIDFKRFDGSEGKFHLQLDVYGKDKQLCRTCRRGIIKRSLIAGRSSFFCPVCQKKA